MTRTFPLALAFALATAFPAGAGPATPEGAQKLTETFAAYLGSFSGAVTVTPQGDTYEVKVDPTDLMAGLKAQGASGSVLPMTLTLTDLGDGKWNVSQDGPFAIAMEMPGLITFDLKAENQSWSGVFDESLKAFEFEPGRDDGSHDERTGDPAGSARDEGCLFDRQGDLYEQCHRGRSRGR